MQTRVATSPLPLPLIQMVAFSEKEMLQTLASIDKSM
jgi:hypothetical protein